MRDIVKVLAVDDDPDWLEFLTHALGKKYSVRTATSGEDALRRMAKDRPDVVIMDVMMPGNKDGFTLFAELQSRDEYRDIPVVMLTEVNQKTNLAFTAEELENYLGSGPTAFLEKPVSPEKLLNEIEAVKQS